MSTISKNSTKRINYCRDYIFHTSLLVCHVFHSTLLSVPWLSLALLENNEHSLLHCELSCQVSAYTYKTSLLLLRLEGRRVSLLRQVRKVELSGNIYVGIEIN
jgi:hypothetical protein